MAEDDQDDQNSLDEVEAEIAAGGRRRLRNPERSNLEWGNLERRLALDDFDQEISTLRELILAVELAIGGPRKRDDLQNSCI